MPKRITKVKFAEKLATHVPKMLDLLRAAPQPIKLSATEQMYALLDVVRPPLKLSTNTDRNAYLIANINDVEKEDTCLVLDQSDEGRVLLTALTDTMLNLETFCNIQANDPFCEKRIKALRDKKQGHESDGYFMKRDILMKEVDVNNTKQIVLVIPKILVEQILTRFHGSFITAHCGVKKLVKMLR